MESAIARLAALSLILVVITMSFSQDHAAAAVSAPNPSYAFAWQEGSHFTVVEFWNAQSRAACDYAANPWPQAQLAAQRAYVLAARQVLRDVWDMNSWIAGNRATNSEVRIHGAETNCPIENGTPHLDFPPHVHVFYLSIDAAGGWHHINSHHYPDANGRIYDNSIIPNLCGQTTSYHPTAGTWVGILDETCQPAWQQRYTASGDLEFRRSASDPVYTVRNVGISGDLANAEVLQAGVRLFRIEITQYDPIQFKMSARISDYRKNLLTTETWAGDPVKGINLTNHEAITTSLLANGTPTPAATPPAGQGANFAMIGDYGGGDTNSSNETAVATMVKSWNPDFIVTAGDDWYPWVGGANGTQFDRSTGKYYCQFLAGVTTPGSACQQPGGAATNGFFPALGNHEYDAGSTGGLPTAYTDYFRLPGQGIPGSNTSGNERYYDFVRGPVHFFVLNSNNGAGQEPDGVTSTSKQAMWLKTQLSAAIEPWKIVVFHHPPFTSGVYHGPSAWMDWPFAQWGASAVVAGHEHLYERVMRNGIAYFTDGTGGARRDGYTCGAPTAGSQICYDQNWGALRVSATNTALDFQYFTIDGVARDSFRLTTQTAPTPTPSVAPTATWTPAPSSTPAPGITPAPTSTPAPGITPAPSATPAPGIAPRPLQRRTVYIPFLEK